MAITIKELTTNVATSNNISKVLAKRIISSAFWEIGAALTDGEEVVVRDFGRFYNHTRPARKGRNPKTGAVINIAERTVIKIVPRGSLLHSDFYD